MAAQVGMSEKKKQKANKKEVIAALNQMVQCIKDSKVEDVELEIYQERPPFGEFADNYGVMRTVPGGIVHTHLQLTFKSSSKG